MTERDAEFTSRPLSADEVISLKLEAGVIDSDVLHWLGLRRMRGTETIRRAVVLLYVAGVGLAAIEDYFRLSEDEAEELVSPIRSSAVRAHLAAGLSLKETSERLEVPLHHVRQISNGRTPRGPGWRVADFALVERVRYLYRTGMRTRDIMATVGKSAPFVARATADIARRPRGAAKRRCDAGTSRLAPERIEEIRRRRLEGASKAEICRELRVSPPTFAKYTRDIPRPPRKNQAKPSPYA